MYHYLIAEDISAVSQCLASGSVVQARDMALFAARMAPHYSYANYLAAIPAVFMGLQTSIETALAIMVIYIISQNVQDNLLGPRINGQTLNIHPAILMPTIVVLARFGLFWVILAGPVAAVSRDLLLYVYGRLQDPPRPAGVLPRDLHSDAQPAPADDAGETALPLTARTPDAAAGVQGTSGGP